MVNKQYISPIRLFEHCSIPYSGEINISRIKKQLNAEFDFAKDGFIEVGNYTYNKNDVLKEIDNKDFIQRLHYHERIWQNKNILAIVENNTININTAQQDFFQLQGDKNFDTFFSPYFAAPFNHIARNFLQEGKLHDVSTLLLFEDFLQPEQKEEGFRSIRIFLDENIRVFKNISTENYNSFKPKIKQWLSSGWDDFLNNLPDDFYSYKIDIAVNLINLTVKIQKTNRKDCRAISSGLMRLQYLPPHLYENISKNDGIYSHNKAFNYRWLIWGVIVLLRLLATGGCH